jgi:hypothetical protein
MAPLEPESAPGARRRELVCVDENGAGHGRPGDQEDEGDPDVLAHPDSCIGSRSQPLSPRREPFERLLYNAIVGLFTLVLLVCAVLLVLAAEWPRLTARFGADARAGRDRRRRKERLAVIDGDGDDDFAASVERDLASLPVIEERDDRSRR